MISNEPSRRHYWIGIDIGGTFADLVAYDAASERVFVHKTPIAASQRGEHVLDGVAALAKSAGVTGPDVAFIGHGTTVATNAVLTRDAPPVALLTTSGFGDLLVIRRQTRPDTFDYYADFPEPLVPREQIIEVSERLLADGQVLTRLDEGEVQAAASRLAEDGLTSVAISFVHSYANPCHEQQAAAILERALPGLLVSTSSDLVPEFREYERTSTTVLNAFVRPVVIDYLDRLAEGLRQLRVEAPLLVMQSNGGIMSAGSAKRHPVALVRSGPAAGVAGAAHVAALAGESSVITLDIGGTSTDVSVFEGEGPAMVRDWDVHSFPVKWTALDIRSIGSGGGSIAWIDDGGLMKVGPHSAGADPGPACYGRGGDRATVTDAHVVLGRIGRDAVLGATLRIDGARADAALEALGTQLGMSGGEAAAGILEIVDAAIAQEVHFICTEKGRSPRDYTLVAYGGAGPLHASSVARELGMRRVLVPYRPGLLCALGVLASVPRADFAVTRLVNVADGAAMTTLQDCVQTLRARARTWLEEQEIPARAVNERWALDMRYRGQNYELSVEVSPDHLDHAGLRERFHGRYEQTYGYRSPSAVVQSVNVRLTITLDVDHPALAVRPPSGGPLTPREARDVYLGREFGFQLCSVYERDRLPPGASLDGPAVIEQMDTTIMLLPDQHGRVDQWGNLLLNFGEDT